MFRIFDGYDNYEMALATTAMAQLATITIPVLTNTIINIKTLDDPYYMHLTPKTYAATLKEVA